MQCPTLYVSLALLGTGKGIGYRIARPLDSKISAESKKRSWESDNWEMDDEVLQAVELNGHSVRILFNPELWMLREN